MQLLLVLGSIAEVGCRVLGKALRQDLIALTERVEIDP